MPSSQPPAPLQPLPLDDEFRCPICLDELSPCLIYSACNHRICANCVTSCGTRCRACDITSDVAAKNQHTCTARPDTLSSRFRNLAGGGGLHPSNQTSMIS